MNPTDVIADLRKKLLFFKELTREELSARTGLSPASITNYSRVMRETGMVAGESFRAPGVKRPIERLRLLPGKERALAVMAAPARVEAELLGCDGGVLERYSSIVPEQNQAAFLQTINRTIREGIAGKTVQVATLCVDGLVAPDPGMIFHVSGIGAWEPCETVGMLEAWREIPIRRVFTQIAAATRGFAAAARQPDHIGLLICRNAAHWKIGTMELGEIALGRCGTPGNAVHRSCGVAAPLCFCGRSDCFAAAIAAGKGRLPASVIAGVLSGLFFELGLRIVGLNWPEYGEALIRALSGTGIDLRPVEDPEHFARQGLRELTAELIPISERIVKHESQPL
ncbi:hypothetical protein [uncultured Victivallis sp.]|uniref:hypothetical protein n=1 Tax=uncultured Victivallis sp. TaxID=354118 RepID=UPI0025E08E1A|nr:hypothetical protein [uncultured Victivallis sp.]